MLWSSLAEHQHRFHQSGTAAGDAEACQSGLVTEQGVYPSSLTCIKGQQTQHTG